MNCYKIKNLIMLLGVSAILIAAGSGNAYAKKGEFGLTLAAGTGYVVGKSVSSATGSSTISSRNPTLLDLDFQYEVLDWLAPSLRVEMTLEDGEALTLVPGIVFDSNGEKVTFYGRFGIAIRIEPNYYGLDIGGGMIWHFLKHLGLLVEINVEPLFLGENLTGGAVVPILCLVGFRGNL